MSTAGNFAYFEIVAKDSNGNNVSSCDVFYNDWNITLIGPNNINVLGDVVNCIAPIYTGRYLLLKTGIYSMYISYMDVQILGSPYSVECQAGSIYPQGCTTVGVHGEVVGVYDIFNVTTFDQNGNRNYSCQSENLWSVSLNSNPVSKGNLLSCDQGFYIWERSEERRVG